jgi:fructose-1,6-bisphosphatase I
MPSTPLPATDREEDAMPAIDPDPPAPPVGGAAAEDLVTIERFVLDRQPDHATGELTRLLYDLALAGKVIASHTRRAGLTGVLGPSGAVNVQGEEQQALDLLADRAVTGVLRAGGRVCAVVSEERADPVVLDHDGAYVVVHDPLDGSSNIDANVSIGTIFGVYRRVSEVGGPPDDRDWLRPGRDLVAGGYVLYGFSTMFVYSAGDGVHAFTLDPQLGEFLLTWSGLRFPLEPAYYSLNRASTPQWEAAMQRFVRSLDDPSTPAISQRYIGSAVADFHRNLLHGGVYGYPGEVDRPSGKIRLLYEAAPLAFLAAQAGGRGSDGARDLLSIVPESVHQRTPVFVGDAGLVDRIEVALGAGPDD